MNYPIRRKGSALVISLAFLVLITVLVVGLMETVRIESASSHSNLNAVQAEFFAQTGVEQVVKTLQERTSGTSYNWISQPGQLMVSNSSANSLPSQPVPLSSGTADPTLMATSYTGRSYFRPPNLNISTFRDTSVHLITENADLTGVVKMPVSWIYVRKDQTKPPFDSTSSTPDTTSTDAKANPIVGRYAFWTDDESCKINHNLAWGRTSFNTAAVNDPTKIDLTALQVSGTNVTPAMADELRSWILTGTSNSLTGTGLMGNGTNQKYHFFNTPEDVLRVTDKKLAQALVANKSNLTHYNSDSGPDTNIFNEKRIALTTKKANMPATSGTYLNILKDENADPGIISNIDEKKLAATIAMLSGSKCLGRTDWPMAPGISFASKFYGNEEACVAQLAINIIEYVRCRESNENIVVPLFGTYKGSTWRTFTHADWDNVWLLLLDAYFGITRAPCLTECGVYQNNGELFVNVEVFSPPEYHLDPIDLTQLYLVIKVETWWPVYSVCDTYKIPLSELSQQILTSGNYVTITHPILSNGNPAKVPSGTPVGFHCVLSTQPDDITGRLDAIPLTTSHDYYVIPQTNRSSFESNDPRINRSFNDWKPCTTPSAGAFYQYDTFGRQNSRYLTPEKTPQSPQQDMNGNGKLSDASFYMPPTGGLVSSVAELGYIHTGARKPWNAGTPWRTVRLQPSDDALPDWALLDLFTVPTVSSGSNALSRPNGNSYGGRININSLVQPFDFQRILPLAAAFQGGTCNSGTSDTITSGSAQIIAANIYNHTLAKSGTLYNVSNGYYSPYEITQISGVADGGEQSEEIMRQIPDLLTTRGNVFTVYSIGETIKQTPSGDLRVTGQKRVQAMVERYTDSSSGEVCFRTVYYRNLTP